MCMHLMVQSLIVNFSCIAFCAETFIYKASETVGQNEMRVNSAIYRVHISPLNKLQILRFYLFIYELGEYRDNLIHLNSFIMYQHVISLLFYRT